MSVRVVEKKNQGESKPNMVGIKRRLNRLQDEYIQLILNMQKDGSPVKYESEDELDIWSYRWKRLKVLQGEIFNQVIWEREESIRNVKLALEEAFTPKLKEMLSKSLEENKDSIIFEGVRYVPEKSKEETNE
tara:strand:- start:337 stop:732 length:396 start_codon:yes stop_codon:yes gene_type:complete